MNRGQLQTTCDTPALSNPLAADSRGRNIRRLVHLAREEADCARKDDFYPVEESAFCQLSRALSNTGNIEEWSGDLASAYGTGLEFLEATVADLKGPWIARWEALRAVCRLPADAGTTVLHRLAPRLGPECMREIGQLRPDLAAVFAGSPGDKG